MRKVFLILWMAAWSSELVAQEPKPERELENFVILTDQDFYLSGDRLWFGAKLLKNHESYRYSKLAYLTLLDHQGKEVHSEKMLLSGQDMVFGDIFLPDNASTGVYSLLLYTKWMSSYRDFPIARRDFLVVNSRAPQAPGQPKLWMQKTPFEKLPVALFHTSSEPELIEVQDLQGKTLEVLERVPPFEKFLINVDHSQRYQVIFRNEVFQASPSPWLWDPSDFSIQSQQESVSGHKVLVHTDWEILEELKPVGGRVELDRTRYQGISYFDITSLDPEGNVSWSYRVNNPAHLQGNWSINSKARVGEPLKLDFTGFPVTVQNGFVLAKSLEQSLISDWIASLNDPNWEEMGSGKKSSKLPESLRNLVLETPILKDYSPMFSYKTYSIDGPGLFPGSFQPKDYSFSLPLSILETKVNRKMYQEHFGLEEEVMELESPFVADKIYYLEDYDEFPDFESFVRQIIPQVKLKKSKGSSDKQILLANTDNEQVRFNKIPVVLVDFYRVEDLAEIWSLEMVSLDRVEVYYHRETVQKTNLGEEVGDGLIVIYTKNNEYALKKNIPKSRYFLSDVQVPRKPDYGKRLTANVTANPLQFLDPGFAFLRGRARINALVFDTAGDWRVESWIFGNGNFHRFEKNISIGH